MYVIQSSISRNFILSSNFFIRDFINLLVNRITHHPPLKLTCTLAKLTVYIKGRKVERFRKKFLFSSQKKREGAGGLNCSVTGVDSILPHWLLDFKPLSTGNVFIDNDLYSKVCYYLCLFCFPCIESFFRLLWFLWFREN